VRRLRQASAWGPSVRLWHNIRPEITRKRTHRAGRADGTAQAQARTSLRARDPCAWRRKSAKAACSELPAAPADMVKQGVAHLHCGTGCITSALDSKHRDRVGILLHEQK
jgi:hypothetical protein